MLSQIKPGEIIWTIQGPEPRFVRGKFYRINPLDSLSIEIHSFDLEKDVLHTGILKVDPYTSIMFTWERYEKDENDNVVVYDCDTECILTLPAWTSKFSYFQQENMLYALIETSEVTELDNITIYGRKISQYSTIKLPVGVKHIIEIPITRPSEKSRICFEIKAGDQKIDGEMEVFAAPSFDSFRLQPYHNVFLEALQCNKEKLICNTFDLLSTAKASDFESLSEDFSNEQIGLLRDLLTRYTIRYSNNEEFVRRLILWFKYENFMDSFSKILTSSQKLALVKMIMFVANSILYDSYCEKIANALKNMNIMHLIHFKKENLEIYENIYKFFVDGSFELDTEWDFTQAVNKDTPL